jgi:hypothetical protein
MWDSHTSYSYNDTHYNYLSVHLVVSVYNTSDISEVMFYFIPLSCYLIYVILFSQFLSNKHEK